jgi:hypothetical protein
MDRCQYRLLIRHLPVLFVALYVFQSGCSIFPKYYIDVSPTSDVSSVKTVGVWKLRSGGDFVHSGDIMTRAFENAFRTNGFTVIDHDQLSKISRMTMMPGGEIALEGLSVPEEILKKFRIELGIDALFIGSLRESNCESLPPVFNRCRLVCSFRLIDTRSGEVIMSGNLLEEQFYLWVAAEQIAERAVRELKKKVR